MTPDPRTATGCCVRADVSRGSYGLWCTGVIVDAKDDDAERFYAEYDFATVTADGWPRRMCLPIRTARAAFGG